jgi:hypothetical protein
MENPFDDDGEMDDKGGECDQVFGVASKESASVVSLPKDEAYSCKKCGTHIGLEQDVESRCYQVGQGQFTEKKRGYLFANGVNLTMDEQKRENFTTGAYDICWVRCAQCCEQLGWKYIHACNSNNCAKEGKFCLARYYLLSPAERNDV